MVKKQCGVEFRHSTRSASTIRQKVGNRSVVIRPECLSTRYLGSLGLSCYVRDTAKKNLIMYEILYIYGCPTKWAYFS